MNVIEFSNVYKIYADFKFSNNSFCIKKGRIVALIGENGAGKTTLINLLLNKTKKDSGNILIFGSDILKNEVKIKMDIGVVLDECHLPGSFSIKEIECFMSKIYANWDKKIFGHFTEIFNLSMNKSIEGFSRGMKKKLDIAIALSHHASLLIFDEPTNGLDITSTEKILGALKNEAKKNNTTILFSTHNIKDIENLADDIIMLNRGKIGINDTKEDLESSYLVIETKENELIKLQKELTIENAVVENGNAIVLINKKCNYSKNCCSYKSRIAQLEDIVYIKIKENYNAGISNQKFTSN